MRLRSGRKWQAACKPNFVEDDHSSRRRITANAGSDQPGLRARPARPWARCNASYGVLLRWGLPCLRLYSRSGALLPHLFTLTGPLRTRRYFLCGTCRPEALTLRYRTLSGTLPCGVRTFLSRNFAALRQRSPAACHHSWYRTIAEESQ